jgi:hypothetical protein
MSCKVTIEDSGDNLLTIDDLVPGKLYGSTYTNTHVYTVARKLSDNSKTLISFSKALWTVHHVSKRTPGREFFNLPYPVTVILTEK